MRSLIVFLVLILSQTFSNSQQAPAPEKHLATPEELIRAAITSGGWDGHMQKQFGKMGDSAAVSVTKVLPERGLSPSEIDSVVAVLTVSFADPAMVETAADREPRATLFVLRYLDLIAPDADTRKKIAHTRAYVQEQFAKYKAKMNSEASGSFR